jgi:hypothetical protein
VDGSNDTEISPNDRPRRKTRPANPWRTEDPSHIAPAEHRLCCGGIDNMLMDRRVRELVLISLLAAFCAA